MGVPPRVIMEIMGHSSLAMTTKYQHVMEGMLDDAADRLANIFPAAVPG
jgi:site-specific recombinase XerD